MYPVAAFTYMMSVMFRPVYPESLPTKHCCLSFAFISNSEKETPIHSAALKMFVSHSILILITSLELELCPIKEQVLTELQFLTSEAGALQVNTQRISTKSGQFCRSILQIQKQLSHFTTSTKKKSLVFIYLFHFTCHMLSLLCEIIDYDWSIIHNNCLLFPDSRQLLTDSGHSTIKGN